MNMSGGLGALIAGGASIHNPDQGVMRIETFDLVGSCTDAGQVALASERSFGMVFKKANPIWAVSAKDNHSRKVAA